MVAKLKLKGIDGRAPPSEFAGFIVAKVSSTHPGRPSQKYHVAPVGKRTGKQRAAEYARASKGARRDTEPSSR